MKNSTSATTLAAALGMIDFEQTNSEIERLDNDRMTATQKAEEAEREAQRLSVELRDWTGPDPEALADLVLGGASPAEAALAAPTREQLVDRRMALLATANALRDRAERARNDREAVVASQRQAVYEAAEAFMEELQAIQARAAQELVAAIAAADAVREMAGFTYGDVISSKARRGVTGADSILGPVDRIRVPDDVVAALKPLEAKVKGLRPVPVTVPNN